MRELTRSFFSFTWAMSLFGANQLANILTPKKAEDSFNAVASATRAQVGEVLQPAFKVGDALQRGMVDLMFRFLSLETLDPRGIVKSTADVVQKAAGTGPGAAGGDGKAHAPSPGWGPVN